MDPVNGYRYYRADQLRIAATIRELRRVEMPLGEIRILIDADQPGEVHDLLARHRDRLAEQLTDAERRLILIEQLAAKEKSMVDITEVDLPSVESRLEQLKVRPR